MVDTIASYQDNAEHFALAKAMERNKSHSTKSKLDFSIVMKECSKTDAPFILIVEDDVVFLDGWRHRTMHALNMAAAKSRETAQTDCKHRRQRDFHVH